MRTHPLKLISLVSIFGLILTQLGLVLWLESDARIIIACFLATPLFFPVIGLLNNKRYTFKWTGFLTLLYFCIGVSESFANPELRVYSILTISLSSLLFVSSIYYSRYLR